MKHGIVHDHIGNEYKSLSDMCVKYGITNMAFRHRLSLGWTLEKALTTPIRIRKQNIVEDHLGNTYISTSDMCRAYLIDLDTYRNRIERGLTVEEALTQAERCYKK